MDAPPKKPEPLFFQPELSDWKAMADKALRGADFEKALVRKTASGIPRGPLRTAADDPHNGGQPGQFPFVRGIRAHNDTHRPWHITQSYAMADPQEANRAILDDLAGGASALLLYLDPRGQYGIAVHTLADLKRVLHGVDLSIVPVLLQARPLNAAYAAMMIACWRDFGCALDTVSGALGFSPIGQTVRHGMDPADLPEKLHRTAQFARFCADHAPGISTAIITSSLIHEAGGDSPLELAFAAAGGFEYFKAMRRAGLNANDAANAILFSLSLDADISLGIAKLRAARRLWARVTSVCGVSGAACAMRIHVGTSRRMMSTMAPYTNTLRTSTAAFAAAVGGAQYISVEPHDLALGTQQRQARRLARNTQIILQEEVHAGTVVDPAGGAYAIEKLTDDLAHAAWAAFQDIERHGGLIAAGASGWLGTTLRAQREARLAAIRRGRKKLVGVTDYVQKDECPPPPKPVMDEETAQTSTFPTRFSVDGFIQAAKTGAVLAPHIKTCPNADFAPINLCAPFEKKCTKQKPGDQL